MNNTKNGLTMTEAHGLQIERQQCDTWGANDYVINVIDPETEIVVAKIDIEAQYRAVGWMARYSLYLGWQHGGYWVFSLRARHLCASPAEAEAAAIAALESVSAEEVQDILLSHHGVRPSVTAGL